MIIKQPPPASEADQETVLLVVSRNAVRRIPVFAPPASLHGRLGAAPPPGFWPASTQPGPLPSVLPAETIGIREIGVEKEVPATFTVPVTDSAPQMFGYHPVAQARP
jgi:hypothetical protein